MTDKIIAPDLSDLKSVMHDKNKAGKRSVRILKIISNALGSDHAYVTKDTGALHILGMAQMARNHHSVSAPLLCQAPHGPVTYKTHNKSQLIQVEEDYMDILSLDGTLYILNSNSIDDASSVTDGLVTFYNGIDIPTSFEPPED